MTHRGWSSAVALAMLAAACVEPAIGPERASRQFIARTNGPLGQTVLGLTASDGLNVVVTGWVKLPDRTALRFLQGRGALTESALSLELGFDDGTRFGTLEAAGLVPRFDGRLDRGEAGVEPATVLSVDHLPTALFLAAIAGAPDAPGRGAASYRCEPGGARLLLVDPTGGQRLEVQVIMPDDRFRLGSIPLGRAGGARGTIRIGGEPTPPLPFVSGVVTVKRLDSLTLVGRVQGIAKMGPVGVDVSINASLTAAGADGSCR